jgi:hypothetical protein
MRPLLWLAITMPTASSSSAFLHSTWPTLSVSTSDCSNVLQVLIDVWRFAGRHAGRDRQQDSARESKPDASKHCKLF